MKHLLLKTVDANMTAYGGFVWPRRGEVAAPDWDPAPECGHGLHGAARGEGDGSLFSWEPDAVWIVAEYDDPQAVDLGGKIKVPRCRVVYAGTREKATAKIAKRYPGAAVIGGTSTSGTGGTSTSGSRGTSTSGDRGTSTSGDFGHSTSGDFGHSTSGDRGHSTSGDRGHSTSGYGGTSTSGDRGHSTSGAYGHSTSGAYGHSTSGAYGHSTSGAYGHSTSGAYGHSTSGYYGIIQIHYCDGSRRRLKTGYIGEGGLKENMPYRLNSNFEFEEVFR